MFPDPTGIPSGSSSQAVEALHKYLFSRYYNEIGLFYTVNRADHLLWSSPGKIWAWGISLIILLFLLTYFAYYTHRNHDELYQAASFAGSIVERNGKVSYFTWTFAIGLFIAAIYLGIRYILIGFQY